MIYAVVIGDGMADEPIAELRGKTPIEFAKTEAMDLLASKGEQGLVKTVPDTLPPGSDTAILSIFGYDPLKYYTGRSPLEAAGSGVILKDGEISFRVNMVALSEEDPFFEKRMYSHSGDNINGADSIELMKALIADKEFSDIAQELNMKFVLNPSFRHIGVASGVIAPPEGFAPPHDLLGQKIGKYLDKVSDGVSNVQKRMMMRAYDVLNAHSINDKRRSEGNKAANSIWFWGAGRGVALPDFKLLHNSKRGAAITAVPLVEGIAALSGMKSIKVPGATGEINTDYSGKVNAALDAFKDGADVVIIHIEAPDECSHMGDMEQKIRSIELLDAEVILPLTAGMEKLGDFRLLILSDHPTLLKTRTHDGSPVPFILYDNRRDSGSGLSFSEKNAALGEYIDEGYTLITELLSE